MARQLRKQLSPVQASQLERKSLLDEQTSPAKLAVAISEDMPQAVIQSIFVFASWCLSLLNASLLKVYHGSVTQYAFILINVLRISACLGLRSAVLKAEDRHAESWKAGVRYRLMMKTLADLPIETP